MTRDDLCDFVSEYLKCPVACDQDLLATGAANSFKFIDLCLELEQKTGTLIDFSTLPMDQYTTVNALYELIH